MKGFQLVTWAALLGSLVLVDAVQAHPRVGWSVGINLGGPGYHHHYHHHPWHYYGPIYRPYPLWYAPPPTVIYESPVVVRPAPVVVRQPAVVVPSTSYAPSTEEPGTFQAPPPTADAASFHLQRLNSPDEAARRDSAMELGRMKAVQAVDPLTATLAGDKSASVRESAARALGLIAAPSSLAALTYAAQADQDRDVRHSAQFAVEIIRANLKR